MKNLLAIIFFMSTAIVFAQDSKTISGKLLDSEFNNNPLAFATITIKGTITETISDIDGTYTFNNLEAGDYTLVYSFVGYKTVEKNISITRDSTEELNIVMQALTPSINKTVKVANSVKSKPKP